ncbi:hypothetical protein PBI_SEBATA_2 [Mycobacterium phage Sebata]|uniref:Uncharacterized protein n=1 Tax=Mycobacterium phage Sebata TaxID=1052672 RepID=G1FI97_9CAUD|nr:hypothetical protein FDI20_gp002 [Mycobacterium phage Sebata]AEK06479.1 hypothetical protein PBI_SEBATA_2 [Mycobacterium phage Sebata]
MTYQQKVRIAFAIAVFAFAIAVFAFVIGLIGRVHETRLQDETNQNPGVQHTDYNCPVATLSHPYTHTAGRL